MNWLRPEVANVSDRKAVLLCFTLGLVVRLVPEILSYPYPIGFDTIYYAAMIKRGLVWQHWTSIFSMWLFDAILVPIHQVAQVDPFALLKLTAPILYALNACGVYYFTRKALDWSVRKGLTASLFCVFQLALLRLSWDLHRNMLGSVVLLFTLPWMQRVKTRKGFALFALLSLLVVLAHILVSVVLFAVILGAGISDCVGKKAKASRVLLAALPALVFFIVSVSTVPLRSFQVANVIDTYERPARPSGLFFLVNYLEISDLVQSYSTYADLALHVFSLFGVLYLWWLPLVLIGFLRDKILDSWTLVLMAGSFGALIVPFCAVDLWNRWMFMLIYPFTFYAVNGVEKVHRSEDKSVASAFRWLGWIKVSRKTMFGMFFLAIVFGSIFLAVPPFFDRFGVFFIPTTTSYLPSTMLYNTVPLRDVKSTASVMEWLNENMDSGSGVLINHALFWWADLYLDHKHMIIYFMKDIDKALRVALAKGLDTIFFVWWNEDYFLWQNESIGWYGLTIPNCFKYIFSSDRISVFKYAPDQVGTKI